MPPRPGRLHRPSRAPPPLRRSLSRYSSNSARSTGSVAPTTRTARACGTRARNTRVPLKDRTQACSSRTRKSAERVHQLRSPPGSPAPPALTCLREGPRQMNQDTVRAGTVESLAWRAWPREPGCPQQSLHVLLEARERGARGQAEEQEARRAPWGCRPQTQLHTTQTVLPGQDPGCIWGRRGSTMRTWRAPRGTHLGLPSHPSPCNLLSPSPASFFPPVPLA